MCGDDIKELPGGRPHDTQPAAAGLLTRVGELAKYWEDGARGMDAHVMAFEKGTYMRVSGDTIALAPPLIIQKSEIDQLFGTVREVLKALA